MIHSKVCSTLLSTVTSKSVKGEMFPTGSQLRGCSSRQLWCCVSFGLYGWALFEFSELRASDPSPPLSSRGLLSFVLCAFFGWSVAMLAEFLELGGDPDEGGSTPQSSVQSPEAYCSICMESKPMSESFGMKLCCHSFCRSCVAQYVATKVAENLTSIRCPEPSCRDGILEPTMCRPIIPLEVLDRWERGLCESVIRAKFYCPFKDCSALLVDERGGNNAAIRESECPHCHRLFCASCAVPWHAGVKCGDYRKLGKDERGSADLLVVEMANTHKWQRCPKCKFYVEKSEGCMFMSCRCGLKFCYRCGTETKKDHYCTKCKR